MLIFVVFVSIFLKIVKLYKDASNAKLSYTKFQGVVLNTDQALEGHYRRGLKLEWLQLGQSFRLLGFHLGLGQLDLQPV